MNQFLESVSLALGAIWANKLRSFMTVLGNIVAVTSIIAVVSLIQGLNAAVTTAIVSQAGANAFTVSRVGVITDPDEEERAQRSNPDVTLGDADAIRRFGEHIDAVMAQASRNAAVSYRDQTLDSVEIQGVTPDYLQFSMFDAARGRAPTPTEIARNRPVTLIGWSTADHLFGGANPIGRTIKIAGVHFQVVGVNAKKGSIFGQSQDEFAVIPLGAYRELFGNRQSLDVLVQPTSPALMQTAIDEATVALRVHRRLRPRQKNNFGIFTSDTILRIYHQATAGIFAVLIGVVSLSLVVGGIVIMNIMLMVVSERTREIGLRKALGAQRRDIVSQVLTESVALSTLGGMVGTGLGFLVALVIARVSPVPASVQVWSVVLGVSLTAVVGLGFGLYPALRAARLDPIEALRRE
ncbi:MAG TPA: ABC transporter permease [Vicinamibacterales bacterium]|nr:ABC transporter permease [Vicinamibacterales bacterium]